MNHESILDRVRQIAEKQLYGIQCKIYLFGSWARNEERLTSDIDLAVWSKEPLPLGTLAKLRSALEEAAIPYPVEVVDLREADEPFIQQVVKEGIQWKEWSNV